MIFADKIIEERKKNGWSQEELAEKLGVSRQAVSKWESAGSVPDLQKVIQLANVFGVSTDYLLKDEIEHEEGTPTAYVESEQNESLRKVSMEEANEFLEIRGKGATSVANGTSLCILSPVFLIILETLSENPRFNLSEGLADGLGCVILLGMIAIAVFMFITYGIKAGSTENLKEIAFETEYGVTGMVKEKKRLYEGTFTRGIALGVVFCIMAVVPVIIAGAMETNDYISVLCLGALFSLVAVGANMIIRVSIVRSSYDILLQEGDYTQSEKKARKKIDAVSGAYWCLVTAGYLGWSFWTMKWNITWIVWPVAGVLFAAIASITSAIVKTDE
ncbi:MAG: helix-turn-helix domain-containing protein [Clostridia bacterium]|nr:helix-turn-helix domain-containing protein [Clostridia bacterium]